MPGSPTGFAIVGIGCRLPGEANTPQQFWDLLAGGVDAIEEVPPERHDLGALFDPDPGTPGKLYTRSGGFVRSIDAFDADFFGISPREARRIDPQHRLLLEVVWEALEDGGQPVEGLAGSSTGVFVGISSHDYSDIQGRPGNRDQIDAHVNAGSAASIAANRVSYAFDLRGPSLAVDTACSSALTATHLACRSLHSGESELAIVAAVNALLTPEPTIGFCKAAMLSPTGRCRPFDARADGYVRSEGAGAVVLKPLALALEAGDPIYAVVRSTSVNQDGRTPGISVPSTVAQQALLRSALRDAGLAPAQIQYVEAHGTGTPVGDPREALAIGSVMAAARPAEQPCLVGSAKGNVGHLEAAAGIVGVIKTALALQRRQIPASLHFDDPNPAIPFDELLVRVPTALEEWPAAPGPVAAAVNSFGFGGANACAILEAPPPSSVLSAEGDETQLLALSARNPQALRELAQAHARLLREDGAPPLRDHCYTAAVRRSHLEHRVAAVARSRRELADHLEAFAAGAETPASTGRCPTAGSPKLAFVFSGMGPQWPGMGRELMRDEPVFREAIEEIDGLLTPLAGWSLLDELAAAPDGSCIGEARVAHVANLALQIALAALWRSWGVVPDAVVGHSSGEMAAAYVAGGLSLADAVRLAFHRGRLQQRTSGTGGMLAAGISVEAAADLLEGRQKHVSLAAVNGPASVTLSGDVEALQEIADSLGRRGAFQRLLSVNVPYHGPQMDQLHGELMTSLADLDWGPLSTPMVSTVSGEWQDGAPLDAGYWWRNVRQPVLFAAGIDRLIEDGYELFVEVAPHPVLAASVNECLEHRGRAGSMLPSLRREKGERDVMLASLATLHARGRPVEWRGVFSLGGRCVRLPAYPWQRERHWFEPAPSAAYSPTGTESGHPLLGRRVRAVRPTWETDLADPRLAYLDGHAVEDVVTLPGAACVELALAAARALRGDGPLALQHVEFHRLLGLPERADIALQCFVDERNSSLEIHSTRKGDVEAWTLRASARLAPAAVAPPRQDVHAIRARCSTALAVELFYESLVERHRLRYSGTFRSVTGLWAGQGEALGHIALPAGTSKPAGSYLVHPALLDGAFQVLGAAVGDAADLGQGPLVPLSISRVDFFRPPGDASLCHVTIGRREGSIVEGNVLLLDDAGDALLACEGVRMKVLEAGGRSIGDWLYEEQWDIVPRADPTRAASLPPPAQLVRDAQPFLDRVAADRGLLDYYEAVEPALNSVAARFAADSLSQLGVDRTLAAGADDIEGLPDRVGVAPEQRRFFARLLELRTAGGATGLSASPPEQLVVDSPYRSTFELLAECGRRLVWTLRGQDDAREWLFADEWLRTLAHLYASNPGFVVYADAVAEVIAATQSACLPRPLRVLEVGAGTGGATARILERLGDNACEYVFTDVSPLFVRSARERFRDDPRVRAEVLDIERPPAEAGSVDVVLAADVVHATADVRDTLRNLRALLAPGGLLILLEVTRRSPWVDFVFGHFAGWWRFSDRALRPDGALLGVDAWQRALDEAGFVDSACLADDVPQGGAPAHSVLLARAPANARATAARPPSRWLVLTDARGVGSELSAALREHGDECTLAWPGSAYRRFGADGFQLSPTRGADWVQLVQEAGEVDHVIHLWCLDAPDGPDTPALMGFQQAACGSVVSMVQAFEAVGRALPEVWIVTAGAQAVTGHGDGLGVAQSTVWGLGRVLRTEQAGQRCRLVDLGADCSPDDVVALLAELEADGDGAEEELAFRAGRRFARRLRRVSPDAGSASTATASLAPDDAWFRTEVDVPGALETLTLREAASTGPGLGQVVIRVLAAGLNFRDVLVALGLPFVSIGAADGEADLGWECAGVVVGCGEGVEGLEPGDEVVALAQGSFASHVVVDRERVAPKPSRLTFEEASTLPVAFVTADYALRGLARLAPGERVLIHSATGGVGLAAVQLARQAGAEIFATAGTPAKRAYLESLGVEHVMDSRTLEFADEIARRTGGVGVDVVLNSLSGEALTRGVGILAPYGRFVELGKRDIYEDLALHLRPFLRNLSFFACDIHGLFGERTAQVGAMLRSVVQRVTEGELDPLPRSDFDLADATEAFRLMAQARHIGKVVFTVRAPRYAVSRKQRASPFRPDASYLVTGGLGGFGLAVASWMVREGARHIALASRTGTPRSEDAAALEALLGSEANVAVIRGDVADAAHLEHALDEIRETMPPLKGVVHAAMVLDDGLLGTLDYERFEAVLAPKVAGAWNLHQLTNRDDLDLFILFSSVSALIGQAAQGSYAAGNTFLGALAAYRRARGLPALTVDWGTIAGVGYVARRPELERRLRRQGLESFSPADACEALREALRRGLTRVAVSRVDWGLRGRTTGPAEADPGVAFGANGTATVVQNGDAGETGMLGRLAAAHAAERPQMMERYLVERASRVLEATPDRVDPERPLPEMGLDSLMAVELRTAIRADLGVEVPLVQLLEEMSLRKLGGVVLDRLAADGR